MAVFRVMYNMTPSRYEQSRGFTGGCIWVARRGRGKGEGGRGKGGLVGFGAAAACCCATYCLNRPQLLSDLDKKKEPRSEYYGSIESLVF